ncbi:unnamed protein product [Staurois parvus]|uniref:Coiled-coil domain-containing protein 30 n=1 Tax=Staurois parvus TaxID=386267 RepID=A0ABN9DV34_9NEOB|nr:unnamed protein product [Staurois parvus]
MKAQLHEETKAQETLVGHQKGYGEDQKHVSNQSKKREDECMMSKDKSKDLTFQLLEGDAHVQNLESALQMLGREKEELEKQVAVLAGHIGLEYKLLRKKGLEQELGGDCKPKNECYYLIGNDKELVDDNPSLCQQLINKDDILNLLQVHLREAMNRCQELEHLATKEIRETTEHLEREKDYVKDRLFELEDLVRRLEQETISNQDDRMELTRLSEDNTFLRNKAERLQQEIIHSDDSSKKYRTQVEELKKETECLHSKLEQLSKQYHDQQNEFSQSNVQLEETILHLNTKLQEVSEQKDKANVVQEQLQGMITALETERHEKQMVWQREKEELEQELQKTKQENEKYWDELCQLNTQSLQLTSTLSDLTAQREGSYETIQHMNCRLSEVNEEKHQASALLEQLQGKMNELKRENLQNEAGWQKEKEQIQSELQMCKQESFETRNELCHLTNAMFQLKMQNKDGQENIQHLESSLKEVNKQKQEATATTEKIQNQLHLVEREKTDWCQARERLEQDLQTSSAKIETLLLQHRQEKQDLLNGLDESNKQLLVVVTLQEEVSSLKQEKRFLEEQRNSVTRLLKEATDKVSQAEELKVELKEAQEECHTLKKTQGETKSKTGGISGSGIRSQQQADPCTVAASTGSPAVEGKDEQLCS